LTTEQRPVNPADRIRGALDADLVAALVAGGEPGRRAWSTLVARYSPRMYAVARSFALNPQTSEDLVQTAWLRLLERVDQLRDPTAVSAWLCTVVRNEARRLTTRRREVPVESGLELRPDDADDADARLLRDERARALRLAFADLGEECQQLLRLLLAEPALSYDEIAAAVGRPRGSLGPTRRRCLEHLRSRLPAGFEP
jgi:RNA polymerase sigma factor (sigma-70 family)